MNGDDFVGNELPKYKIQCREILCQSCSGGRTSFYVVSERWLRGMKSVGENEA